MRKRGLIAVSLFAAAALFATACDNGGDTIIMPGETSQGITVNGVGSAFGEPDKALLSLGVEVVADTVEAAREEAAAALTGVIQSARDNGVDEDDIQTAQFSVYPRYNIIGDRQVLEGYTVVNVLSITIREIENASAIIDDAVAAGGDRTVVHGIQFSIDDPTELENQAREAAVNEAKERAEQLARLSGVDLGEPIVVSESGGYTPIFYGGERAVGMGDAATSTPIEGGQLEVQIYVTLTYRIGG
jgi:uncharacterized protein YggE